MVQNLLLSVGSCLAGQEVSCFYGTWRFITVFTKSEHLGLIRSQLNPDHTIKHSFAIYMLILSFSQQLG